MRLIIHLFLVSRAQKLKYTDLYAIVTCDVLKCVNVDIK